MIERYTLPEMGALWTDESKFRAWLDVEIAACEAWGQLGVIPKSAVAEIRRKADFNVERILEIEEEIQHDVIAFLTNVAEYVGPNARYVHYGLTSSDVLDIAQVIIIQKAARLIRKRLVKVISVLKRQTKRYAKTVHIGRTHGVHAEPTTFGLKLALWYREMLRNLSRFDEAVKGMAVGKVSGSVGNFAHVDPRVEKYVCRKFKLKPATVSSQIIQRDRHAHFLNVLAVIGGTLEKFAVEVRGLQKTEIGEVEEGFGKKQKGSSSMPHKKNPIYSEKISGLARLLRGYAIAGMENQALWHERDISHSSVERVIIPDACIIMDYNLSLVERVLTNMVVNSRKMKENLWLGGGLVFSQRLLLALTTAMPSREQAYKLVQTLAMTARNKNKSFKDLVDKSEEIGQYLSKKEIDDCFDVGYFTKRIDSIIKRALD